MIFSALNPLMILKPPNVSSIMESNIPIFAFPFAEERLKLLPINPMVAPETGKRINAINVSIGFMNTIMIKKKTMFKGSRKIISSDCIMLHSIS